MLVGDGLTILQADTFEEARALMENEPLIRLGFRLRPWELREGQILVGAEFLEKAISEASRIVKRFTGSHLRQS